MEESIQNAEEASLMEGVRRKLLLFRLEEQKHAYEEIFEARNLEESIQNAEEASLIEGVRRKLLVPRLEEQKHAYEEILEARKLEELTHIDNGAC